MLGRSSSVRRSAVAWTLRQRRHMGSDMPTPQSQKAKLFEGHPENEGWEWTIAWFYTASAILIAGNLAFAPPTEITAWARKEAEARLALKEQGVQEFAFGTHYQDLSADQAKDVWDKFSAKALRMTDDDDDDEDEEEDDE